MYKGKSFDMWYVEENGETLIQLYLHYNKTLVTVHPEDFVGFKKELSKIKKLNFIGKFFKIEYKKEFINLYFINNKTSLQIPLEEFRSFKQEVNDLDVNKIKSELYVEEDYETDLFEAIKPKKNFSDLILTPDTQEQIKGALAQIKNHDLIFKKWGLGDKHYLSKAISLNFVGQPGTGKTLAAEVLAHELNKKLYLVQYSNLVDSYIGETGKNIKYVFQKAKKDNAVLFFDEADSIISTRTYVLDSTDSLINMDKNILLKELENFDGIIIFSTNLAVNIDKAFERRISSHVHFRFPSVEERESIYKVLIGEKMPIDEDVDFRSLAKMYEFSGGDIKNVVLNAVRLAATEEKTDEEKTITMKHFIKAADIVKKSKTLMEFDFSGDKDSINYIG